MTEPEFCCPDDTGGSHYHCPRCGCTCSVMGHAGKTRLDEFCPPVEDRPSWAARFIDPEVLADDARREAGQKDGYTSVLGRAGTARIQAKKGLPS